MSLVHWSVPGWISSLCLRRLCAPYPSGCVAGWSSICPWASVVLSSLRCSSLPLVGVTGCLRGPCCGLGLSWVPCPSSASLRFVPRLVARLAPCSRWRPLTGGSSLELRVLWGSSFSPLCSPGCWSASRSTFSALPPVSRLFLGLLPSPSGEASVSTCQLSWHHVTAGPLALVLHGAASLRGFFPLSLVLPLPGSVTFLALVPHLEALLESLALSIGARFAYAVGRSPYAFGSIGALGELRWLHLCRLTPDLVGLRRFATWLWSSGRCFLFFLCDFPHVSMALYLSVSLTPAFPYLIFTLGAVPWTLA